jgi:hypothetical protein
VGPFTATCSGAVDNAGNHADAVSVGYTVVYPFTGFLQPVDNPQVVNVTAAGKAVPVRFRLGGNRGSGVLAGSPTSQAVACNASAPQDKVETTVAARSSSFSYVPAKGWYAYVWKTSAAWAHTCRRLDIRLADGTTHTAFFRLT